MPNINITIPNPILLSGQYFKTRYRTLPSGSWSSYVNRSNAMFTLTGLATGNYQLEVILVKADATQCAAVYQTFSVVPDPPCVTFVPVLVKQGSLFYLEITWTLPPGYTAPACGWELVFTQTDGTITKQSYSTLPSGGKISLAVKNLAGVLSLNPNLCSGNIKDCPKYDVLAIATPCTPITVTGGSMSRVGTQYYITVNFTQASPPASSLFIKYFQFGPIMAGYTADPGATITPSVSSTATSVTFPVKVETHVTDEHYHYSLMVQDYCGAAVNLKIEPFIF